MFQHLFSCFQAPATAGAGDIYDPIDDTILDLFRAEDGDFDLLNLDNLEQVFQEGVGLPETMPTVPNIAAPPVPSSTADTTHERQSGPSGASRAPSTSQQAASRQAGAAKPPRKRVRSQEQKEKNKNRQAKSRASKKNETDTLYQLVDTLTAQIAALKAVEVREAELAAEHQRLSAVAAQQAQHINALEAASDMKVAQVAALKAEAAESSHLVRAQQHMILDQHARLRLQEEVVEALRAKMVAHTEMVLMMPPPGMTLAQSVIEAMRSALRAAKRLDDFHALLAALPAEMVQALCECVLDEVAKIWPEVGSRLEALQQGAASLCAQVVQPGPAHAHAPLVQPAGA